MVYTIFGFDYVFDLYIYQMLLLSSALGLYIRLLLSIVSHQLWLRNYSQYLVFGLLPITGYIITSVISTNIALSLGMVGALSIVRFRTPVKNPSELVIYFCLITVGIVVNVSPNIATNFVVFVTFIVIITEIYVFVAKKLNLNPFGAFVDDQFLLSVVTKNKQSELEEYDEIIHVSFNEEYMYRFKSSSKKRLLNIIEEVGSDSLISYSLDEPG